MLTDFFSRPYRGAFAASLLFASSHPAIGQAADVKDSSRVVVLSLESKIFQNRRNVRVYLPPGYSDGDTTRRYPVLFMNDGFAVFSPRSWNAPSIVDSVIRAGSIPPMIVVAIDNAASISGPDPVRARTNEYLPYADSTEPDLPHPEGLKYPSFVVDEVLPLIKHNFRVLDGSRYTGIGGSSYGGIAALTTALRYPEKFGVLLLESTPLFLFHQRLVDETRASKRFPASVYVGIGTRETEDTVISNAGRRALDRFIDVVRTRFPASRARLNVVEGASHNSTAWRERLPDALVFLYGSDSKVTSSKSRSTR